VWSNPQQLLPLKIKNQAATYRLVCLLSSYALVELLVDPAQSAFEPQNAPLQEFALPDEHSRICVHVLVHILTRNPSESFFLPNLWMAKVLK
jgi:hypothetical protein